MVSSLDRIRDVQLGWTRSASVLQCNIYRTCDTLVNVLTHLLNLVHQQYYIVEIRCCIRLFPIETGRNAQMHSTAVSLCVGLLVTFFYVGGLPRFINIHIHRGVYS